MLAEHHLQRFESRPRRAIGGVGRHDIVSLALEPHPFGAGFDFVGDERERRRLVFVAPRNQKDPRAALAEHGKRSTGGIGRPDHDPGRRRAFHIGVLLLDLLLLRRHGGIDIIGAGRVGNIGGLGWLQTGIGIVHRLDPDRHSAVLRQGAIEVVKSIGLRRPLIKPLPRSRHRIDAIGEGCLAGKTHRPDVGGGGEEADGTSTLARQ